MTPPLPSGTVTFLFTDIEGSTKLWQAFPNAMPDALARHHAILHEAIETHRGYVFQIIGDAFCSSFSTATDGLYAALAAQRALHDATWGETGAIRVRMALHTGAAEVRAGEFTSGEYVSGLTLSRTARLLSVSHGGQTLLSQSTNDLVRDVLPENVSMNDLGEHRLKDLRLSEHIYQLDVVGLSTVFPPLQSLDAVPNNLPVQLTSFVGREHELSEIKQLLTATHLLTLTGPGGTGKTRLSLQLAAEVLENFADGVWLVELAPLADPTLIAQMIATTLGVREQPGRPILDALLDYVRTKSLLLILDNCEHLIEACAQRANTLLRAAPRLKILASSREALGIAGETAYHLPSLPLPDLHTANLDALSRNDCVRLFVDRAMAANSRFRLTEKNAPSIANICLRLDGIPLAIELAAARTKVFPPEQIAARLNDRFRLLTGGSRTALERHQTLRALIDWSYDLLTEAERWLLRRLSIFAGGWSIEAAQAVCSEGIDAEVLDLLTHLVDKSLVTVEPQVEESRYGLLETIRQYARDKLFESGEAATGRDRHLDYFITFAEEAEPKLRGAEQGAWLKRVETEHDNVRTALAWSLESGKSDSALRLAGALYYFWELRGFWSEGQRWLDEALELYERAQSERAASVEKLIPTHAEIAQRAKALYGTGRIRESMISDLDVARTTGEESLRLWRELGDKWWMAVALEHLGSMSIMQADYQTAFSRFEEGVSLAREVEDQWPLAVCLLRSVSLLHRTDVAAAHRVLDEGVAVARRVGDQSLFSWGLIQLAAAYFLERNLTVAATVAEEALAEARATGSIRNVTLSLAELAFTTCLQGNLPQAKDYCFQLMALGKVTGNDIAVLATLFVSGFIASFSGQPQRGARLLAAIEALVRERGSNISVWEFQLRAHKQALEKAKAQLDPATFEAALQAGRALTLEQALDLAMKENNEPTS